MAYTRYSIYAVARKNGLASPPQFHSPPVILVMSRAERNKVKISYPSVCLSHAWANATAVWLGYIL